MDLGDGRGARINSFALVAYLDDPLAAFLNDLRHEIVPDYEVKAHLTILPPRPIQVDPQDAWAQVKQDLVEFQPLHVELDDVAIFPESQVIYIAIRTGLAQLERMNQRLNRGALAFEEPFEYHPHVTLAKDLPAASVEAMSQLAAREWREARVPKNLVIDRLTFVQNTLDNSWIDLAALDLASAVRS